MSNEKYESAYQYYKSIIDKDKNLSRDAQISQVAQIFGLRDIKRFHSYVLDKLNESD